MKLPFQGFYTPSMDETPSAAIALPPSFTLENRAGEPLPETVRARMEAYFEADFSTVRVHVGMDAPSLGALAFTVGESIHFAPEQYQPFTERGLRLLGHELAHVVQQRSGRVPNPFGSGFALIHDPVLEAEADQQGLEAATHRLAVPPVLPRGKAGHPLPPARAPSSPHATRGYSLQATFTNRVKGETLFLFELTNGLFEATKKVDSKLMEVQASIFNKRLFIASNYSRGADNSKLLEQIKTVTHDGTMYTQINLSLGALVDTLHAEQQILRELAKILRDSSKANPIHVTIVGSKRPCSICHRVLRAFQTALTRHYPYVELHFVDLTGATCEPDKVASLELGELVSGATDDNFAAFVSTYDSELAKNKDKKMPGEEESSSVRTNATPKLNEVN